MPTFSPLSVLNRVLGMNKWDSSREMHTICLRLLFYPRKPPGSVLCFRTFRAS